jgi:hypothetical protein
MGEYPEVFREAIQKALDYSQVAFAKTPKTGHTKLLRQLIEGADVAVGVSEDLDRSKTWIVEVIKGVHLTAGLIGDKPALKLVAISCTSQEEALAMRLFGDGKLAS